MTSVQVAKLKLQCDTGERDRMRFAIEDGLRTTIPDDPRLVLLRRMRVVGRMTSASPAQRQAAMRSGWLAAVEGARHGGEDGAADANCVWFASREEAEALLLSRLLAGRAVQGWFWRLAVPVWVGQPARSLLRELLVEALAANEDQRLLAIIGCCEEAGASDVLVEMLADPAVAGASSWRQAQGETGLSRFSPGHAAPLGDEGRTDAPPDLVIILPPALRETIARLVRVPGDASQVASRLVRAWVLRRSPALALAPPRLAAVVAATVEAIRQPLRTPAERKSPAASSPRARRDRDIPVDIETHARSVPSPSRRAREGAPTASSPRAPSSPAEAPRAQFEPVEATAPHSLHSSRHAGLWLVIPSLARLGFREWLADRPALLTQSPGALLLHAIARHYRVAPDDPALLALAPPPDLEVLPEWVGWWRHGLDRWLRRTARRRLHDLVRRPGQLGWDEWRVDIRYPGADADIALRRHALDRDPGWTDWLGLSVRYQFGGREDWL